jgi:hypothetical protein
MKRAFVLLIALVSGCAAEIQRLDVARSVSGAELAPYAIHEECVALDPGERISYRFKAQPAVSFNIHYRDGNAVVAPIDIASTADEAGVFVPDRAQGYCLTWEAGAQGSRLDYRVEPLRSR